MRCLIAAVAAAATVGGGAVSVPVLPAVAWADPPADPATGAGTEVPSAARVGEILTDLADPSMPDAAKSVLVQGGIDAERRAFTRSRLRIAAAHGELPLTFAVGNVWSVGPDTAAAAVQVAGPKLPAPVPEVLTFVRSPNWVLSSDSAATLIHDVKR